MKKTKQEQNSEMKMMLWTTWFFSSALYLLREDFDRDLVEVEIGEFVSAKKEKQLSQVLLNKKLT